MAMNETIQNAFNRTFKELMETSEWPVNLKTVRADYITHVHGYTKIDSVGWHWWNDNENFCRCAKVMGGKITDYYKSYEVHNYIGYEADQRYSTTGHPVNFYSEQVDPKTMKNIVSYFVTRDGVHKYDKHQRILVKNIFVRCDTYEKDLIPETHELNPAKILSDAPELLKMAKHTYMASKKPYGDLVYVRALSLTKQVKIAIKEYENYKNS